MLKPTIAELAELIAHKDESIYSAIEPVEEMDTYPASSAQKRLYILYQLNQNSLSYNMPLVMLIKDKLDQERFKIAVDRLIARHEALRTSFEMIDGEVVQRIHKEVDFKIGYQELVTNKSKDQIVEEFIKPFDLSTAPLLRIEMMKVEDEHLLMIDMHHIISDGVSRDILFSELVKFYNGQELPELRIQYKDFAGWQNKLLESDKMLKQEEYWLGTFAAEVDEIPVLNLPTDYPRPLVMNYQGARHHFKIDQELTVKLNKLAQKKGATLFMVLLSAYNIVLSKYSGQEDIIVGSPIAGRPHADLEKIMGIFINTLAHRNRPEGIKTISEFLTEVKENSLLAYDNQDYQFEMLVEKIDLERDLSRNPLFNVIFGLQNFERSNISVKGFAPYPNKKVMARFDLSLNAVERENGLNFGVTYRKDLFKIETIERLAEHFTNILSEMVLDSNKPISEIEILTDSEKDQLLYQWNQTEREFITQQTLQQIFEEQVVSRPDETALIFENKELTYGELNSKANQLARLLRAKGVKQDEIVGILVERSFEMMIGVLAILKAGGAYMPISSDYPEERIAYMLEDSNTGLLLVRDKLNKELEFTGEVIDLHDQDIYTQDDSNLEIINSANDLAYLLYTSGSTGKPKGVMVEHHSVLNTLNHLQMRYPLNSDDIILQSTAYTFDASVREIFWWFFNGAKCCLLRPDGEKDPKLIVETIASNKVTVVKFVPILLNEVLTTALEMGKENLSSIKYVFVGGEALSGELVNKFYQVFAPGQILCNLYGPTETTIHCTEHELTAPIEENQALIGRPISNVKIYVFDKWLKPVAKGVVGEIYVSGINVARGYINNPQLTAERFILNPYISGERLYKTGDLGRWSTDGTLEFMGRVDHQVKIRGFRVELGEIENQLLTHSSIKETVVTVHQNESGDKSLCAYLVTDEELTSPELKDYLSKRLARYMIPTHYIILDKMPLTSNGKINRKALPDPDGIDRGEIIAPRNEIEAKLLKIWQKILGRDQIGVTNDFFEVGGHSLKATRLTAHILKEMNVEISLLEIFEKSTIAEMAELIAQKEKSTYSTIEPIEIQGYYPASSAQKRLFVLEKLDKNSLSYNMPFIMNIDDEVDPERLEIVLNELIKRHEVLRTSFELVDGETVQRVHKDVEFKINYLQLGSDNDEIEKIVKDFIRPFDLSQAPLLRVDLVKLEDKHLLMIDMHHIISDGVSRNIFFNELIKLYDGEELPPLRIQYKDFAAWQNKLFESEKMKKQEDYWLETFADGVNGNVIPVLNLPTDYPRPAIMSFEGDRHRFQIDKELTSELNKLASNKGATLFMVLLSAYNILLSKYSGQEDIIVGTPIEDRTHADLELVMGMFVNTLALRNKADGNKVYPEFLQDIKS